MELLFVLGLPIALAKTAQARAVLEAGMIYLTFNYFVASILSIWGDTFGVDYSVDLSEGAGTGLKMIAGIKTLDTGIFGAIIISAIVVWSAQPLLQHQAARLPRYLPGHPVRLRPGLLPDDARRTGFRCCVAHHPDRYRFIAGLLHLFRCLWRLALHLP